MTQEAKTSAEELIRLHQNLTYCFSEDELRTLCFKMQVDYDNLPGEGKEAKARELVMYLKRRERIPELIKQCSELRPTVPWDSTCKSVEPKGGTKPTPSKWYDPRIVQIHGEYYWIQQAFLDGRVTTRRRSIPNVETLHALLGDILLSHSPEILLEKDLGHIIDDVPIPTDYGRQAQQADPMIIGTDKDGDTPRQYLLLGKIRRWIPHDIKRAVRGITGDQFVLKTEQELEDDVIEGPPIESETWLADLWRKRKSPIEISPTHTDEQSSSILQIKIADGDFDVFLCHNSDDKSTVKEIGERLKRHGILPWLDADRQRIADQRMLDGTDSACLT